MIYLFSVLRLDYGGITIKNHFYHDLNKNVIYQLRVSYSSSDVILFRSVLECYIINNSFEFKNIRHRIDDDNNDISKHKYISLDDTYNTLIEYVNKLTLKLLYDLSI